MVKTYFTFGSDPLFPFSRDEYVVACGKDLKECIHKFMERHPNPRPEHKNIANCAFIYNEKEFLRDAAKYYGPEPAEVIE